MPRHGLWLHSIVSSQYNEDGGGVLTDKTAVLQLVKKIPAFCGNQRSITEFRRSHHWLLS
jgi:hypothetical protein